MGRWRRLAVVGAGYLLLGIGVCWPLPLHLFTHLPGNPGGDTGVYVWNLWVFHHEAAQGSLPVTTSRIFAVTGPMTGAADLLAQHNATLLAGLFAFPLIPWLGVVGSFNIIYILQVAASGFGAYVLCYYVTKRSFESWIAGVAFAAAPAFIARGTSHFSLVAAMPVPVFARCALGALDTGKSRWAVLAGVMLAWASYNDPYFGIYCVLLGGVMIAARVVDVRMTRATAEGRAVRWRRRLLLLDAAIGFLFGVVLGIATTGGIQLTWFGRQLSATSLYTPVLALTILALARLWSALRPRFAWRPDVPLAQIVRLSAIAVLTTAACLSPWLVRLGMRAVDGRLVTPEIFWRSSPPGVDLLSFVMPNPGHPLFGRPFRQWLEAAHQQGYVEFTAALPLTALAVVIVALFLKLNVSRTWLGYTIFFAACALGPFVHIGGVNTYVPGPWALLRYVPVIEWARSPSRLALVVVLTLVVTFATSLVALRDRAGRRRGKVLMGLLTIAMGFSLWPAPRQLYRVEIPAVYAQIAADPDPDVAVLELPVGMRDGTSSMGNFSAMTQFYQTVHGKRIVGGYLSRISNRRKEAARRVPAYRALLMLSEGRAIDAVLRRDASRNRQSFLERSKIRYVVIETARCPAALRSFAIDALDLVKIGEDRGRELFRVRHGRPW